MSAAPILFTPVPAPVPTAALELLDRAGASLLHASRAGYVGERYVLAHLAGLRAAAAVLAARATPSRRSRPRSVWELLPRAVPELAEWAAFFAGSARLRARVERGEGMLSPREADDLVREAQTFIELVCDLLGAPRPLLSVVLTPVRPDPR